MKAQASIELLITFMIMLLISSILISSFPHDFKEKNNKLNFFEEEQSIHSKLSVYYLTGNSFELKIKCSKNMKEVSVFNKKINPFLCSINPTRRWFLR